MMVRINMMDRTYVMVRVIVIHVGLAQDARSIHFDTVAEKHREYAAVLLLYGFSTLRHENQTNGGRWRGYGLWYWVTASSDGVTCL